MNNCTIHIINDLKRGGSTKACLRTISYLNLNAKVIILDDREIDNDIDLQQNNIHLYSLDWSSIKNFKKSFLDIFILLKKENDCIINCWLYKSIMFGTLMSIICKNNKLIWHIRHEDVRFDIRNFKKFLLIRILALLSFIKFKKIYLIYNSKKALESHLRIGFQTKNNFIINNGFDTNKFKNDDNLKEKFLNKFKIKKDIFLISMYARFHPIKDHLIFFKAIENILSRNNNIHIFLAGRYINNSNNKLIRLIKKHGLSKNITLGGMLSEEDLIGSYSATELTVLTSNSESFPNVIGESMSCSTPCLCFDVGDCKKIIGSSGWIVRNNNLNDLVSSIENAIEIYSCKESWNKIRKDARKNIYNLYNDSLEKRKYLETFDKIFRN
tara:strand:+ start:2523 stop:3671 length:1149 start_codon:yes stop_codon:yes gene_type:complete